MKNQKVISDVLWASGNDWDREWMQQVVDLLVGHGAFTLYPALSQCDNAAERLTRWLTFQLPRVKQAHPGCPIHQWLNSIGAQVIVEKWQSPEQWPNLYWLPLPEVDSHAQGGLVLLPAHFLPVYGDDTIQTRTLPVAVGTSVTRCPPHRSVRAELPHTAPALGCDVKTNRGIGMLRNLSRVQQVTASDRFQPLPRHSMPLTSAPERM